MITQEHIVVDIAEQERALGGIDYAKKHSTMEDGADHQETS
jgi:hypothetical protein